MIYHAPSEVQRLKTMIVGGAGFVGSHLSEALLGVGHDVTVVDNLLTGRESNIRQLLGDPNFCFVRRDAITPITASEMAEWGEGIERIYYLASPASPDDYFAWPVETLLVNSAGVYNFLQLAERNHARFLLTSTSEAYGDPLVHPQPETYWGNVNPVGPRSCYDEGKRFAESMTMAFVRNRTVDGRIVRIFNTYGPRMKANDGRVVSNFIYNSIKGKSLVIYGDGSYTRSFCYVSDLVRGLQTVMEADSDIATGEVFNLGNPDEHTILEFAKNILRLTGADVRINFEPARTDDPTRRKPDITKVQTRLGWKPQVMLEEGLNKTIEWFKIQQL